jgi:hypothetical protein
MKTNTAELTGAALDWAVAKCEGPRGNAYGNEVNDFIQYSRDWAQGGPIIEREGIAVSPDTGLDWWVAHTKGGVYTDHGPTPLIAAMRCYVASKLGDEVEVPDGLP